MNGAERNIHELADEYVLGLLEGEELARVEAEIEHDGALRAAVAASRDRFVELDLVIAPAAITAGLWQRIEERLGAQQPAAGATGARAAPRWSDGAAAAAGAAANDNARRVWRRTAIAAMAASLLLAVGLGWSLIDTPQPRIIAVLLDEAGEPLAIVEDFGDTSARVIPLTAFDVPPGRTMQVWTKPSEDIGPVSLGLLEASRSTMLEGPPLPEPAEEQLYEITIEQAGGSPTGRPTGPILVKGFGKRPL